jgi:hypothetical protein
MDDGAAHVGGRQLGAGQRGMNAAEESAEEIVMGGQGLFDEQIRPGTQHDVREGPSDISASPSPLF